MRQTLKLSLLLSILFFQYACDNREDTISPYTYIPLEKGQYAIYDVKEENYSAASSTTTIKNYQEKDEIVALQADKTYLVARYIRTPPATTWQKQKELTLQLLPDKLLCTIDNKTYLRMAFPIDTAVTWNANTYNNQEAKQCQYTQVQIPAKVGSQSFSNTLKVVEDNYFDSAPNILNLYRTVRQYALGTGLIYEEENALEYCQETEACIGEQIIDSGFRKTRKIVEYGKN